MGILSEDFKLPTIDITDDSFWSLIKDERYTFICVDGDNVDKLPSRFDIRKRMDRLERKHKGTLQVAWATSSKCPAVVDLLDDDDGLPTWLLYRNGILIGKHRCHGGRSMYEFVGWLEDVLKCDVA
jgi:hypothetical protein